MRKFLEKYGIWLLLTFAFLIGLSLCYFRNATLDDPLYLRETMIMTEVLRTGQWFGNYAVGIHGFLFKLPVALLFFLTGSSLLVASLWTIILGCISLYLFFLILKKLFSSELWALAGTLLFFTNFQFILNYPTYMREIPAIFCFLLVLYCILFKKSRWLLGLSLVLLLDAKEYVMMMVAPGILLYLFISEWGNLKNIVIENFKTFLPTLLFVLLMIFTTLIPLNTYVLSTIGLTETGIDYHLRHFEVETATRNLSSQEEKQIIVVEETEKGLSLFDMILLYIGKLLYPYSFSFLSIPKILFFPAFFTSILLLKKFHKEKKPELMSLTFMLLFYFLIFVFKSSFTRYLFPITPVVIIFFIYFLRDLILYKRQFLIISLLTLFLVVGGLFFEEEYVLQKIILNAFILISFFSYLFFEKMRYLFKILIVFLISAFSFSVVMYFFYARGQIYEYLNWGRDYEVEKIVKYFDEDEKIMLNDPGWDVLPLAYRQDTDSAAEFVWQLKEWVPRKKHLKNLGNANTYKVLFSKEIHLKAQVEAYGINRIGLIVSDLEGYSFVMQEELDTLLFADWLELESEIPLKNKTLFIFKVVLESQD